MLSPAHSPRRRRQRGNAMVETALIILPLFALMFAIIDFSQIGRASCWVRV